MEEDPYVSPEDERETEHEPAQSDQGQGDVQRGRMIVGFFVFGIFAWDVAMFRISDSAIGILLIDLCAAHFMWTGSRLARWYFAARCSFPGLILLPLALYLLNPALVVLGLILLVPGWILLRSRRISQFFEFQRKKKRDVVGESRADMG